MQNFPMNKIRWNEIKNLLERIAVFYKEPVKTLMTHGIKSGRYTFTEYAEILGTSRQNLQIVYGIFPSRIKRTGEKEK